MNPARFQTIEEIFLAALEQEPDQVNAFLDTACEGDALLRHEVEVLLASDQRAGRFIETSSVGLATKVIQNQQADSLVGRTIGHYKISESIGTGGMGEVYLATDITAGRKAALKLLPLRFTGDAERLKRFQQEARAVVGLNHPNILTVYEIGEDHSIHYIASELIEGETLRQRLIRGRIQVGEAVDVAIQVASALAAAHQGGIVHRDIKPENIMLRPDGYAKVLDFGIAKLAEQELPATMPRDEALLLVETNLGAVLGTVRYMSPEQACGGHIDKRTDIWSLGVVLYEMVTGNAPFIGDTPQDVMSSILEKEPSLLTRHVAHVPAELQQIISKTLRKNRDERYHNAREPLKALKDLRHKLEVEAELERSTAAAQTELQMAAETAKQMALEIGHVLFVDIVSYSQLSINEQHAAIAELTQTVRSTEQFRKAEAADRLIKIATGDGMALVFYTSPEAPVRCAMEISRALKQHPRLHIRMGIHSGPVSSVTDVTGQTNLAGAGLNLAQRVMECGDAGHILLSKHVAEDMSEFEQWRPLLHDLGTCEVKHGLRIAVVNLWSDDVGNREAPQKFRALRKRTRMRWAEAAAALLLLVGIVVSFVLVSKKSARSTSIVPEKSIAVLPFQNLSRDPDNAYFADGIQEEILTRLAKIAALKVISRTSTQRYQSKPGNLAEIAKQLGVANILEGSVQKAADQVRVNVQLVNARTDFHLWAETYDRKLTDLFGVESEVAKAIAEALQAKLTGGEQRALAVKPTDNSEAYDAYLRGLALEARTTTSPDDSEKAVGFYERAVQLDPAFALAWARLSRANAQMYFGPDSTPARRDATERALKTAQKLQPNSPETLLAQAYYQYWVRRDYELAKATFDRVRELLPGSSDVPAALALIARRQGHWDESVAYWEQTLALDPRNTEWLALAAQTYANLRQFPAALKTYDRLLDIVPNDPETVASEAEIYQAEGNLEQAGKLLVGVNAQTPSFIAFLTKMNQLFLERQFDEAIRLIHGRLTEYRDLSDIERLFNPFFLVLAQENAGDIVGARAAAQQMLRSLEPLSQKDPDNPNFAQALSLIHAALGQKDAAIKEAERAITLLPSGKDAVDGPRGEENLAFIEVLVGDKNRAIPRLQHLLQVPYSNCLTPTLLRLDPKWDSLRGDPAFQKLCEEKPR